jgi:signal transduction histidine kinase
MKSLFTRVFLAYWLSLLFAAGLSALVTTRNFTAPPRPEGMRHVDESQRVLQKEGVEGLKRWLAKLNRDDDQRLRIFDADGRDIAGGPGMPGPVIRSLPESGEARPFGVVGAGSVAVGGAALTTDRPPMFISTGPWLMGPHIRDKTGNVYTLMDGPRGRFESPYSQPERYLLIALAVLISAAAAYWVARTVGEPIRSLQTVTQRLAAGQLAARPDDALLHRGDELGALSRAFDDMAERMSTLLSSRQHLLRELSHEMRAPLARLRVAVDLIDQADHPHSRNLARVEQEADRLERLADGVLTYARMEQETGLRRSEGVDFVALAALAAHDICFELKLPDEAFVIDAPATLTLQGDPALLQIAIENLLRNAATHGGTVPAVQVSVQESLDFARLVVRDHGMGVDPQDLSRLFKPFSRLPRPHGTGTTPPGNGLGLAIVAQVAKLHGGLVHAGNARGGGLEVTFELPVKRRA